MSECDDSAPSSRRDSSQSFASAVHFSRIATSGGNTGWQRFLV